MEKVDLKDRRILYQLDLNSRQSSAQIGKKVGLSKKVVAYRIKRMQDKGIIKNFWTVIDSCKLGYDMYRYYLVFQNVNTAIKNEIIEYFVNYKNTCVIGSVKGTYDISLVLWIKNIPEFYKFWDKTNDKYGDYFKEKAIEFAWDLLTNGYGLPAEKLYASIYLDDDEAFDLWHQNIGIPDERIVRFGEEDNFCERC